MRKRLKPCERQWALAADWLLRETLGEVKSHDVCGLGQRTARVLPEMVGLGLAGLTEIQRSLMGQRWRVSLEKQTNKEFGRKNTFNADISWFFFKIACGYLKRILQVKTWIYCTNSSPGPSHPWVWHQSPHRFHTVLVSSTNPDKHEKD